MKKFDEFLKQIKFDTVGFSTAATLNQPVPEGYPICDLAAYCKSHSMLEESVIVLLATMLAHIQRCEVSIALFVPIFDTGRESVAMKKLSDLLSAPGSKNLTITGFRVSKNQITCLKTRQQLLSGRGNNGQFVTDSEAMRGVEAAASLRDIPLATTELVQMRLRAKAELTIIFGVVSDPLPEETDAADLLDTETVNQLVAQSPTYGTANRLFYGLIAQQVIGYFQQPPTNITELAEATKALEEDRECSAFHLVQSPFSALVHKELSLSTSILFDALVWRVRPLVTLFVCEGDMYDRRAKFCYFLAKAASAGKCFSEAQNQWEAAAQLLRANQLQAQLQLDFYEQKDNAAQIDIYSVQLDARAIKETEGRELMDGFGFNELKAHKVVTKTMQAIKEEALQVQLVQKRREIDVLQKRNVKLPGQQMIINEKTRIIDATRKEHLRRLKQLENEAEDLAKYQARLKTLEDDIVSGKRLEKRWLEEIDRLQHGTEPAWK